MSDITPTTYDALAFDRAELVGWEHYARIYANMIILSGIKNGHVYPDSTQSTKMCLWHHTMNKKYNAKTTR